MKLKESMYALASVGMLLCVTSLASAQIPSPGDRDPSGRVFAKMVVTITGDAGSFGHPVSDLRFLVVSENGDRVSVRTNDAGVASTWISPGSYRFVNPEPYQWNGNAYTWDVVVAVRTGTGIIKLSQSNASRVTALTPDVSPRAVIAAPPAVNRTTAAPASTVVNSITEGFFIAPHFLGASLQAEDEPVESGGGFGLSIGYGLSRGAAFFLTIDAANIDIQDPDLQGNYTLAHGDLGVRFNFRDETEKAIPYVQAAFTARVAQATIDGIDFQLSGPAFTAGAGLSYYFQPKLAFDVGLSYSLGRFDTLTVDGDEIDLDSFDANGARFQLGLTWFPFASQRR